MRLSVSAHPLAFIVVALGGIAAATVATAATPRAAEYAIRWNARDGGPKSGAEAVAALGARVRRPSNFKVDYYDLPAAVDVPPGYAAILRRRVSESGRAELTWKLRGDRALADISCPLRDARQSKAEVDVTLGAGVYLARRYSYSCESEHPDADADQLTATLKACTAQVTRWERGGLKFEEWHIAGGVVLIDVSRGGPDTAEALAAFRKDIAGPLLAAGIVPLTSSKSEQGSACP